MPKCLLTCKKPFCTACQYGKLLKRPWWVKGDDKGTMTVATRPGQVVSVDQLESNTPGFIAQLKGKLTQQRYNYATVFVDQFSGYTFVYFQHRITSEETVQAKHAFESAAEQRGVKIVHYHANNGRFADNAFIMSCNAQRQSLSYCGVNAHFQNGIAERRIWDLQEQTWTSMLYAMNRWKKMILICLWPYAMRHADNVANSTPRKGEDDSPLEKFTGVPVRPKLRHFHAFGCPTYVLDNALQSGQGMSKGKQRAHLSIYLGPSPSLARTVALILNPRTGHVSPQFHVKFDDFFETVGNSPTDMDTPEPEWKYLSGFAIKKGAADKGSNGALTNLLTPRRGATKVINDTAPPKVPDDSPTNQQLDETTMEPFNETIDNAAPLPPAKAVPPVAHKQQPITGPPMPAARQSRSGRMICNTPRYEQSIAQRDQGLVAWEVLLDQDEQEQVPTAASQYKIQKSLENPLAFAASDNPDILYLDQATKAPDRAKFVEAVRTKLDGHEKMGNNEPVPLTQVPKGTKLIDMVWLMRHKRRIKTQEVYKWKVCLNVHGGQQEHGVHYWDSYAPVVTWQTVHFFLILSILLGWKSRQLDFVMVDPQAPAEIPLYMRLPQGYKRNGITRKTHALKLLRNVYGQKTSRACVEQVYGSRYARNRVLTK